VHIRLASRGHTSTSRVYESIFVVKNMYNEFMIQCTTRFFPP